MTRRAGFVPVRLSRHRAKDLARWLDKYEPLEPGLLETGGEAGSELFRNWEIDREAVAAIAAQLKGVDSGRPRKPVSIYYLPVRGIALLNCGHIALSLPRRLRPLLKKLIRATKARRGPKVTQRQRAENLANGFYALETIRRYRWQDRKRTERLREQAERRAIKPSAEEIEQAQQALRANPHLALIAAARRWLV